MLNKIKVGLASRLCAVLPPPAWHKLLPINLVIPCWHIVSDEIQPHISGLYKYRSVKQFKDDVDFFLKFYEPVSLTDIISHLDGCTQLPKRCFLPTFDDGFREIYEIAAPILYSKGVSGILFVTTATIDNQMLCYPQKKSLVINQLMVNNRIFEDEIRKILDNSNILGENLLSRVQNVSYLQRHILDRLGIILGCDFAEYTHDVQPYLSSNQIKTLMKKGFSIGAHSIDHPLYSELTIGDQIYQTVESVKQLSRMFEYPCNSFAFPNGDSNISHEYFQKVFTYKQLKVTFGIGSILNKKFSRNLPRFSMERTDLPAKLILGRQFGRTLFRR